MIGRRERISGGLFDRVAEDYSRLFGRSADGTPQVSYWMSVPGDYDPLYREGTAPSYREPFFVEGMFLYDQEENEDVDVGDHGLLEREHAGTLAIAWVVWQATIAGVSGIPAGSIPKEGDVVRVVRGYGARSRELWFYVNRCIEYGIDPIGNFTEWRLDLKARSSLTPERMVQRAQHSEAVLRQAGMSGQGGQHHRDVPVRDGISSHSSGHGGAGSVEPLAARVENPDTGYGQPRPVGVGRRRRPQ